MNGHPGHVHALEVAGQHLVPDGVVVCLQPRRLFAKSLNRSSLP